MPIEFIRDVASWDNLTAEWNELLSRSAVEYPFLRCEFLRAWWDHLGGGEWPSGELQIAVWKENGALQGIAPLFRSRRDGDPGLFLIGSVEISDYLDVMAAPDRLPEFCAHLLDALAALPTQEFRALDFSNLQAGSPTIPILEQETARRGWTLERAPLQVCPVIDLPPTWEEHLSALEKKSRHEIRRKLRRAEGGEEKLELKIRGASGMEEFFRLMACDKHKASFLTPLMRTQFLAIAEAAAQAGMLELAFLEIGGRSAAAYMNFAFRNRIWVYNSGMDPQYAASSPGWVLLAILIRRAIESGYRAFDFMRGDEPYKFQWGGKGEPILRLTVRRP
ncbi:MAG: GNAT family N-acetyltransferase [Anaerolineales bacterium]|nr:GNAT family N-acetyltransferase [Anaerolineales bacterium]